MTEKSRSPKLSPRFLVFLFVLALMLRVVYIGVAVDNSTIGTWLDAGPNIALNLFQGNGYVTSYDICQNFRSFRTPAWPLTLYGLWMLFGYSLVIPKIFQALLSALSCVFIALLGSHLFNDRVGRLAGLAVAFCTTLIRWTGTLGMETMAVFFITLGVYWICVPPARFTSTSFRYAPAALALGLLCLTRPFWLPYVALVCIFVSFIEPGRKRFLPSAIAATMVALVMSPWIVRNILIHDAFVPSSTDGGLAFIEANNPVSLARRGDWIPGYAASLPDVRKKLPLLTEIQFDRLMYRKGLAYVTENPVTYLRIYLLRLGYLWRPSPPPHAAGDLSRKHILLLNVWWSACFGLMIIGFLINQPWKRSEHWPLLLVLLWASFAIPLFSSQPRYRAPLEPFALLYGAAGCIAVLDWWERRMNKLRPLQQT